MTPFIRELRIRDPLRAFAALAPLPYSLFFDSADRDHPHARYSFIVSHPIETIESKDGHMVLTNWEEKTTRMGDVFETIAARLRHWIPQARTVRGLPPFQGGAAGYFGYDLARGLEMLPETALGNPDMPDLCVGIYDQVLAFDHLKDTAWIITHARNYHDARKKQDYILEMVARAPPIPAFDGLEMAWKPNFTESAYREKVRAIIDYIKAGDIFQANLTRRFDAQLPADFDPFAHYCHMRAQTPAPFAAYMHCGPVKISSASPERFITVRDRMVETRPIKGTRPRGATPQEDTRNACALQASEKDRAENTMIVDLLRNDLSRSCLAKSVRVTALCALESFSNVHHLVSTIRGTLKKTKTPLDLLKDAFPGGSITGAPKIRAMEIIEELEPVRRGPYCGCMVYAGFDGTMDSSILIRTLVYDGDTVSLQAGGGIVADSTPEAEYQETLDKISAILESFSPATGADMDALCERSILMTG